MPRHFEVTTTTLDKSIVRQLIPSIINDLCHEVRACMHGGSSAEVCEAIQSTLSKMTERLLIEGLSKFPVTVDYDGRASTLGSGGEYDWRCSDVTTANFPVSNRGIDRVELVLVNFTLDTPGGVALRELYEHGLRAATLPELLSFGERYQDKQLEFSVVALGSVWHAEDGTAYVPFLSGYAGKRRLDIGRRDHAWHSRCRFASVLMD